MDQLELAPEDEAIVLECRHEGEDGKVQWAPETPVEVRRRYEQVVRNRQVFSKTLLSKPAAILDAYLDQKLGSIEQLVQERVTQVLQQTHQQQAEQQALQQALTSNPWMTQVDPRTNQPMIDPRDNLPMFSEAGERVFAQVEHLHNTYKMPVPEALQMALAMAQTQLGATNSTPAPPPPQPTLQDLENQRKQQQQNALRGATNPVPPGQGGFQNGTATTTNGQYHRNPDGTVTNAPARPQNAQSGLGLSMFDRMGFMPSRQ